jgi:light-regulated signal transduction histidine kinase (bacteriophytochrome)
MNEVLEEARQDLTNEAAGRIIHWRVAPLPDVECDRSLMRLVWQNLLSNAVKYTATREQAVIEVGAEVQPQQIRFFVRDNGVGFDMRFADKLFGVFQRLHREEDFAGNGIGLANAKRIVGRHGGHIWAKSEVDQGAEFSFTLPRASSPAAIPSLLVSRVERSPPEPSPPRGRPDYELQGSNP